MRNSHNEKSISTHSHSLMLIMGLIQTAIVSRISVSSQGSSGKLIMSLMSIREMRMMDKGH